MYPSFLITQKQAEDTTTSWMKFLCVENKGSEVILKFIMFNLAIFLFKKLKRNLNSSEMEVFCFTTWDEQKYSYKSFRY